MKETLQDTISSIPGLCDLQPNPNIYWLVNQPVLINWDYNNSYSMHKSQLNMILNIKILDYISITIEELMISSGYIFSG